MAAFCLEPGRGPYVWWQAGAWAGKSALLSTFVLCPPPEVAARVRMVSFFITARLAAQDTREAFSQVLIEQLADLTGQELPAVLPEVTREAYLLDLLAQAANTCRESGGRLVLVVDGLDEDRGETTGPNAHSIAALLPADPPAGMRVIVAGRPNPPIPDDVPGWHPLRNPGIIHPLEDSPYAQDVERLGRQELQRLLRGTEVEQDLLGLLAAARGGLSGDDLEELTGAPLWEIEEIVHTVAGRTFVRRASQWAPGTGPEVYLLGHEELHAAATRYLGRRLGGYHDRLHGWADSYRIRGWPGGTPEYLLSGYYRLLITLGDLPRMIACANDADRHDRMLDVTGGDTAALAEIRIALDLIAVQDVPDLADALCLACHRDLLTDRNTNIPSGLPAVWVSLGQTIRAEALAASITERYLQAAAMAQVAEALAGAGQHEQAVRVAGQAEAVARSVTDLYQQANALAQVARALAGAGRYQDAEAIAQSITRPGLKASALAQVAALAGAGQHQHADQAEEAAGQLEAVARSMLAALAGAGQHQRAGHAEEIAAQLEAAAQSITSPYWQANALIQAAGVLARMGQPQDAEAVARSITDPDQQANALILVAEVLAGAGQHEQAARVAGQAQEIAWSITSPCLQADALVRVAVALARSGQPQDAEAVARSMTDPDQQADALTRVAKALAGTGQHEQAARVAGQAEAVARSITSPGMQADALARVAEALARAGRGQDAEEVARSITSPGMQADALARVAEVLAGAGQHEQAARVAVQAEAAARSITSPDQQANALAQVAEALARVGDSRSACRLAAASCTAGRWTTAATPILLLAPSAFAALASVLDGRKRLQLSQ